MTSEAGRRAEQAPDVARHLDGKSVERCVYVRDRLMNLVTFRSVRRVHYGEG